MEIIQNHFVDNHISFKDDVRMPTQNAVIQILHLKFILND